MYKFWLLPATCLALISPVLAADVLVESRTGGKNHSGYSEPAGTFIDSNTPAETAKSAAPGTTAGIGSRKSTVPTRNNPADQVISAARFTPPIETAGDYHVYITFPRASNSDPITVLIKSASGQEIRQTRQDGWGVGGASNADTWIDLGTFPFTPEGDQYVELQITGATRAADTRNLGQMFADAVRFSTEPISNASATLRATPRPTATPARETPRPTNTPVAAPLNWTDTLTQARTQASEAGKNVFVYFYSPASSRSAEYEITVLRDATVQAAILQGYVPVRINMETNAELVRQLQVFRAGTIGLYNAQAGNALMMITNTPPAAELVQSLNTTR